MLTVPPGDVHMLPSAEPQLPGSSSALRGRRGLADPAETLRAVRALAPGTRPVPDPCSVTFSFSRNYK